MSTLAQRAPSPWAAALAADAARLDEPLWANEMGTMTRRSFADGFARMAREKSEWAGLPVPLMGEKLTIEKSYFGASSQDQINRITNPALGSELRTCMLDEDSEQTALRNIFWSDRLRGDVMIWQKGKRFTWGISVVNRLDYDLRTLGCADGWSLETEQKALELLQSLLSHQQFRQYLLTGQFIETSKRSGVFYVFRRLRPTLAISGSTGTLRILAALCLHPIAYFQNSFAGAMCPSDDVAAHLALMRGDEKLFWRRANQHHPIRPEAGL